MTTQCAFQDDAPECHPFARPGATHPPPFKLLSFSPEELGQIAYGDAVQRLEALSRLPSLIRSSRGDKPLEAEALRVLLDGVTRAHEAAIVQLLPDAVADDPHVRIVQAQQRLGRNAGRELQAALVFDAVRRQRKSVAQRQAAVPGGEPKWTICVPLPDDPEPDQALYLTGRDDPASPDGDAELRSDLKFVKLVADTYGALLLVQDLQQRQSLLSRFLTRPVLAALGGCDSDRVLTPKPVIVTVMFCDLHDSCHLAEQSNTDLSALCERMMDALSIMTEKIVHEEGVISDFQGDAALGFWGWPFEQPDQVERAARAALAIQKEFRYAAERPGNPLHHFRCGIGIAHGPAIAGKMGTADQCKIGVFGPVVNLASRIESATRRLEVPILVDAAAAARLAGPSLRRWSRLRRVAQVKLRGIARSLEIHELLPPRFDPNVMSESARLDYEHALEAFLEKNWENARERLGELPEDGPGRLLNDFMARHADEPPPDWDGTIPFEEK